MRFTTVPAVYTELSATEWINRQRQHAERGTAIVLAIIGSDERLPVGMVGLFALDHGDRTARLGYWLLGRARGRGLAIAAARALTAWAFYRLDLQVVIIDREPSNLASARVADKLGATKTGVRVVQYEGSGVELVRCVIHRPSDRRRRSSIFAEGCGLGSSVAVFFTRRFRGSVRLP